MSCRDLIVKGPFQEEFDVSPDGSRFLVRRVTAPVR